MNNNFSLFGGIYLTEQEDYLSSLCVQWSLELSTDNLVNYICTIEDLSLEFRNKFQKEYTSELFNLNNRTDKQYISFVESINKIYILSKLILFNAKNENFIKVIKVYSNVNQLDFTDFLKIVESIYYSSIELASKYWK